MFKKEKKGVKFTNTLINNCRLLAPIRFSDRALCVCLVLTPSIPAALLFLSASLESKSLSTPVLANFIYTSLCF